jgi:excisionase family DNA binding protein
MQKMTVQEYAKSRGTSDKYVYRMISEGVIPKQAVGKLKGRTIIDKDLADRAMEKNTAAIVLDGKRLPPTPQNVQIETIRKAGAEGLSLTDARTLTQRYRAALLKIELDQATGRLVEAEQVKVAAFNKARQVRDSLLNISDRISPILAAEKDQMRVAELLTAEIRQALEGLST